MLRTTSRFETAPILLYGICGLLLLGIAYAAGHNSATLLFGLVGLVFLFWIGVGWRISIPALLLVSCVDGMLKFLHSSTAVFVLKDVVLVAIAMGLLINLAMHPELRPRGTWRASWPWFLYLAFLAVDALNPSTGLASGIAGFRAHALFSILFLVGIVYFNGTKRLTRTANIVIAGIVIASIVAFIQFLFPDAWGSLSPGLQLANAKFRSYVAGAATLRTYGTMVDPAALGLACTLGILFAAAGLARAGRFSVAFIAAIGLMGMGLLFSGSRASLVGLAVGMLTLLVLSWRHKSMRVPVIVALATVLLASPIALKIGSGGDAGARFTSSDSLSQAALTRAHSANVVYAGILTHPFGAGLGASGGGGRLAKKSKISLSVDNLYLSTIYETGFIGLALLLLLQGTVLFYTIKAANEAVSVEARSVYIGMAAAQVGLLVTGFWTQGSFDYAPVAQVFWLFAGAVALPKRVEGAVT